MPIMLAVALAAMQAASTPPVETSKAVSPDMITRAEAQSLAQRSIEACEAIGEKAAAFVFDADGNLRAASSSDGLNPIGLKTGSLKGATVLAFRQSTRDLEKRLTTDKKFADQYGKDPRYFYHPGALPLYKNGRFVAVLALGGGHDKDEACGLEALKQLSWAKVTP